MTGQRCSNPMAWAKRPMCQEALLSTEGSRRNAACTNEHSGVNYVRKLCFSAQTALCVIRRPGSQGQSAENHAPEESNDTPTTM